MGNGFQYFDLLIYAAIAVFLVIRLGRILGRRTGFRDEGEGPSISERRNGFNAARKPAEATVIPLPGARRPAAANDSAAADPADPVQAGLAQIAGADPSFNPDSFLEGAEKAFEFILKAYAEGDEDNLKPLLAPDVHARFAHAIRERASAGQRMESAIVSLKKREIVAASLEGREASVTIRFSSDQIIAVHDAEGKLVDGDPNMLQEVNDLWTFSRMVTSRDPNWQLRATASADDVTEPADSPAEGKPEEKDPA